LFQIYNQMDHTIQQQPEPHHEVYEVTDLQSKLRAGQ